MEQQEYDRKRMDEISEQWSSIDGGSPVFRFIVETELNFLESMSSDRRFDAIVTYKGQYIPNTEL